MKKLKQKTFTRYLLALVSLVLFGTNAAQAALTTTPVESDYTFIAQTAMNGEGVSSKASYDTYIQSYSTNANGYAENKGTSTINGESYFNCMQIKKERGVKFSVAAPCTVTVYGQVNGTRCFVLGTADQKSDIATCGTEGGVYPIEITEEHVNEDIYLWAESDLYLAGLVFTFPSEDDPEVTDPTDPAEGDVVTFDFNASGHAVSDGGTNHDGDITEDEVLTEGGVTMTITPNPKDDTQKTENRYWGTDNGPQLRMYHGTITLDAGERTIIKVVVNGTWKAGSTFNGENATNGEWTGEANVVVLDIPGGSGRSDINSITVYLASDDPQDPTEPEEGNGAAAVKMTYVDYSNADTAMGEVETAKAGYNKIANGEVGFVNTSWNCNWITYLQVDASEYPGTITKATLKFDASGSTDDKRTTGWGVGYNNSTWSAEMTYNTADKSITTIGGEQWTTTKSSTVFESFEFDITEALKKAEGKIATILVYETAAAGGYLKNPTVEVNYTTAKPYAVTFVETNEVEATVMVDGMDVTNGAELINGDYEFTATATGYKDYAGSFTVEGADKVVEFTMEAKAVYNYTVKGVDGEGNDLGTVAEGTGYEGENVTYHYPMFAQDGTTLYKKTNNSSNPYWGATGLLDTDNKEFSVTYGDGTVTNVVFYKEAEEMEGLTPKATNNADIRCSNGMGGITDETPVALVTLPVGKYVVHGQLWGTTGLKACVIANTDTIWAVETTGSLVGDTAGDEFTLTKSTELYVLTKGGNDNHMLDYLYIVKTGDVEIFGDEAIEGEWNFTINDHYVGVSSRGEVTDKYTATLEGNTVIFADEWDEAPIVAEFTAKNTLTFKKVAVSEAASPKMQDPFTAAPTEIVESIDPEAFTFAEFTATFDPEAGTLTFPEGVGLAYGAAISDTEFNYEMAFDLVSAKKAGAEEAAVRRWDFTKWSEATVANLKADAAQSVTEGWSDVEKNGDTEPTEISKDNCFWSVNTPDEIGGLSANKVLIDELKGLKFGANVNNRGLAIAVNYPFALSEYHGGAYLWLGGANKQFFTIPAVKAGSTIKMGVESHKTTDARGVDLLANGESIGKFTPTTYEEHTWTVTADAAVNIVVDNTNGCHIYFIEVEQDQEALLAIVKADLETVLGVVSDINTDGYTAESVAALTEALENAQAVQNSNDAETIAEATYALLNAKAALVDIATGINTVVKSQFENGVVYNLQGQKVMKAQKGLYIINGKKVVVK